jgi:hypothetical protein
MAWLSGTDSNSHYCRVNTDQVYMLSAVPVGSVYWVTAYIGVGGDSGYSIQTVTIVKDLPDAATAQAKVDDLILNGSD